MIRAGPEFSPTTCCGRHRRARSSRESACICGQLHGSSKLAGAALAAGSGERSGLGYCGSVVPREIRRYAALARPARNHTGRPRFGGGEVPAQALLDDGLHHRGAPFDRGGRPDPGRRLRRQGQLHAAGSAPSRKAQGTGPVRADRLSSRPVPARIRRRTASRVARAVRSAVRDRPPGHLFHGDRRCGEKGRRYLLPALLACSTPAVFKRCRRSTRRTTGSSTSSAR
jgi:hypothetical protein